jgi:hypothetical protein
MEQMAALAGFIAAHSIWSVSDGPTLITMIGSETVDGERTLQRLVTERLEESVMRGREQLSTNPDRVARAVLAFDGYITLPEGKTDAVFLEAREYASGEPLPFQIAVPYRNAASATGFAVYRPKLLELPPGVTNAEPLLTAFWAGVDAHPKAAEIWNAHLDQSR